MKTLLLTVLSAIAIGGICFAQAANATPPCQTNWELKSDGVCRPIYSVPTNGYDPYDPSGEGFLRGLGPDASWEGLTALIENPRLCSPKFLTCEQRSV